MASPKHAKREVVVRLFVAGRQVDEATFERALKAALGGKKERE
jgi:hypothetical protein